MQNYDNLISKALKSYKEKNFQQALYYYNLFKKQNKNLENLVDFNINYVNKLIKNNKFIYIKKNNIIKPDISIIVPVYNASKYLQQCLESIINQTFKNLEIICIDDGSTDNSIEILKKYADIDNRITIISQENKYAGYARNVGIGISKGEYLLFLDSDDFFDKKLCEKLYKKAITNDNDIVICNTFFYDDKTSSIKEPIWSLKEELLPSKEIFSSLEVNNCIFNFTNNWPWNKLIKKELIEKNKIKFQEIKHTNDTYFICMCLALSKKISIVKERLIYYRINSGKSLTTSSIRDLYQDEVFKCLDEIFNKLKFYNLLESFKYSFYTLCTQQLFWNYNILSNKQYRINFINKIINRNFYDLNLDEFKFFLKKQHYHDTIEKIEKIF